MCRAVARTDVTFNVVCARAVGSIRVTVATTGSPADPNGYQVTLDGGAGQHVDADGSLRVDDVPVGSHAVGLGDMATNCSVSGGPSRQVAVTTGGIAEVRYAVSCSETGGGSGSILVTTETSGSDLDPDGYSMLVDGDGACVCSGHRATDYSRTWLREDYWFSWTALPEIAGSTEPTRVE